MKEARGGRKKVLMVVPLPPPVHGASLVSLQLTRSEGLRELYEIRVIPLRFASSLERLGVFSCRKLARAVVISFRLVQELILHRPDLAYCVVTPGGFSHFRDLIWTFILRIFRVPRLCHVRELGFSEGNSRLFRWRMRMIFANAHVAVLSPLVSSDVSAWVPEERIHVIPNGLPDCVPFSGILDGQQSVSRRILFLSNFMVQKGVFVLMDATRILRDRGIAFHLIMAGAFGRDIPHEALRERIRSLGIHEHVTVHGPVNEDEKLALVNRSALLVFPTLREAFGNVLLEAMRAARPVVASRLGSIPWITPDGECGLLFTPGDPNDLADKLEILLRDGEKRSRMGKAGRRRFARMFTVDIFERRMAAVMDCVISGKKGGEC